MQKNKRIVAGVICICVMIIGTFFLGYCNKKYPFAEEAVRDAWLDSSGAEYMLEYSERKELSKILRTMQGKKIRPDSSKEIDFQEMILYSSCCFRVETKKATYELTLYGKVGEVYVCAIDEERYQVSENIYKELDMLYDSCFRKAHEELFDGFQDAQFIRLTSGIGKQEEVLSETEREELVMVLQSMKILSKAEENPMDITLGMDFLSIETEKDFIVIDDIVSCGEEGVICSFNGASYWIDKESGERLAEIISSTGTIEKN